MSKHPLLRRRTAVLLGLVATATIAAPLTAVAEPRTGHAPLEQASPAPGANDDITDDAALLDACPVDGPATFEDSWGWARSGGRSHQGVDLIAGRGTPIVAVRDGAAEFKNSSLGGRAVWLTSANGDKFYYAHLDDWNGESRDVQAGELIGWVGSTGNARGAHLHFETQPGGVVENPYWHTLDACLPSPEELITIEIDEANALNDPAVWERFLPHD